jgi:hypothetical protein
MHAHHSPERLMAQLDGARLVKYDGAGFVLAWFGGHGVHAYDGAGTEVDYWNTGDFGENDASFSGAEESMARWILGSDEDDEDDDVTESATERCLL